jgi:hypothetical protein
VSDQNHITRFRRALCRQRRTGQHERRDEEEAMKGFAHGRVFYARAHVLSAAGFEA